jgi:hypothetical protein
LGYIQVFGNHAALTLQSSASIDTVDFSSMYVSNGGMLRLSNISGTSYYNCHYNLEISDSGYISVYDPTNQTTINFLRESSHTISIPSPSMAYFGGTNFHVGVSATMNLGSSIIFGTGYFIADTGITIGTSHPQGLNGNLQVLGTKTIPDGSSFIFYGDEQQMTGNMMPVTVRDLTIGNIQGVTLSGNAVVNGLLSLYGGFSTGNNSIVVNGSVEMGDVAFAQGSNPITYGVNTSLIYTGTQLQTSTNIEFPSFNGPKNLTINNLKGVALHESRTINGALILTGKLIVGVNTIMAATATSTDTNSYVMTEEGSALVLTSVGSTEKLFPVGTKSAYAPVWVMNTGTVDTIRVGVVDDYNIPIGGGRVKARWNISEQKPEDGIYRLKFGWMKSLEDSAFSVSTSASWKIFKLPELTEPGSGTYTRVSITGGRSIRRAGVTILGTFTVGTFTGVGVEENLIDLPSEFRLSQNYPNPFNPITTFSFGIPSKTHVTLKIYDLLGREVVTLVSEELAAGNYARQWNAEKLSSGIYFYRLQAGTFTETKKLVLLK